MGELRSRFADIAKRRDDSSRTRDKRAYGEVARHIMAEIRALATAAD